MVLSTFTYGFEIKLAKGSSGIPLFEFSALNSYLKLFACFH